MRRDIVLVVATLALAFAFAFAPVACAATETTPVLVDRTDGGHLTADARHPALATFSLLNLNPTDEFYVRVSVDTPGGWTTNVTPNSFFLAPSATTNLTLTLTPTSIPAGEVTFHATLSLVLARTGDVTKVTQDVIVGSSAAPRILGLFANPFGAPLDSAFGTFAVDLAAWALVAALLVVAGDAIIRSLTLHASGAVTREIGVKLRKPIFYVVAAYGIAQSFAALPRYGIVVVVERLLLGVVVGVFGLYVVYRILDAFLFYYQQEIAPKTETKIDDVLVPAIRKVGVVVLWVAAALIALRAFGWDPSIIFAGAGIAGLVIAFAAQDTFSNLFSGVFLMLDQPFKEGDIIVLETGEIARVEEIGLRTTRLYEYDHHHSIIVPNNQLATKRITNYSAPDSFFKSDILIGVSYDADPERVKKILIEVAAAEPEVVTEGSWSPQVQLRDFEDSSLKFMLRVTLKDPRDKNRVPSKIRMAVKKRFEAEGIEIPYPQRVVHVRNEG